MHDASNDGDRVISYWDCGYTTPTIAITVSFSLSFEKKDSSIKDHEL